MILLVQVVLLLLLIIGSGSCQAHNVSKELGLKYILGKLGRQLDQRVNLLESKLMKVTNTLENQTNQLQNLTNIFTENSNVEVIVGKSNQIFKRSTLTLANNKMIDVLYEQDLYGGDWIIIQHRFDGSVDFYRNWTNYRNGFGNFDGEFWLGLENIHLLTSSEDFELLVHLEDHYGVAKFARYEKFAIGAENEAYQLKILGPYSGTAGDSLGYSKGHKYSTYDRDNDEAASYNCAVHTHGAWWYRDCSQSNLNGFYKSELKPKAMSWYGFNNEHRGLKISKIMIKAV